MILKLIGLEEFASKNKINFIGIQETMSNKVNRALFGGPVLLIFL